MKTKSILTKTIAVAALSLAGIGAINQLDNNEAQAAVVQNDAAVYTTTQATTVYNNYENPVATGQTLAAGTNWKIILLAKILKLDKKIPTLKHKRQLNKLHKLAKVKVHTLI